MIRTLSILTLTLALVLSACGGGSSSSEAHQVSGEDVHVSNFRLVEAPNGERQVMGTLENASAEPIENAQVQVTLFDANNVRIDSMSVMVSDVPASGEVQFKQSLDTGADVEGARVHSVLVM